ncbi:response regulator [Cellulophaga sp. F20128]|uniref:response regulator n=1 Tax=Cellulophaga sp. F20128 TaxID=2926413 RepID=UPI001FF2B803|nr:response regulator [Cellulophaga sp. F20128]MCK0157274.1 response regulator [Cellulophaga sp. F20128]
MKIETVCIIDDDPIFVYGTKILLNYNSSFGSSVIVHENGKEALDDLSATVKCGEKLPDIIFLDLNMPIMNGWEFLDEFTKLPMEKRPRVYIVSFSIDKQDVQKAYTYEIVKDFIEKPLSFEILTDLFKTIEAEYEAEFSL